MNRGATEGGDGSERGRRGRCGAGVEAGAVYDMHEE